ncbi:hypothetical protein QTP88_004626 [Uroleucon formosanum]
MPLSVIIATMVNNIFCLDLDMDPTMGLQYRLSPTCFCRHRIEQERQQKLFNVHEVVNPISKKCLTLTKDNLYANLKKSTISRLKRPFW